MQKPRQAGSKAREKRIEARHAQEGERQKHLHHDMKKEAEKKDNSAK